MFSYMPYSGCISLLQKCYAFVACFYQLCALYIVFFRCDGFDVFIYCDIVLDYQSFGAFRLDNFGVFSAS